MLPEGETCLEVGCASGWTTKEISKKYPVVFGITVSREEFQFAEKHYGKEGVDNNYIGFRLLDMHNLPWESDFDAVVMSNCIGQALSPFIALAEANKVLKDNGVLLINIAGQDWADWKWHYYHPTEQQLKHLFDMTGFIITSERHLANGHYHCLCTKVGGVKL